MWSFFRGFDKLQKQPLPTSKSRGPLQTLGEPTGFPAGGRPPDPGQPPHPHLGSIDRGALHSSVCKLEAFSSHAPNHTGSRSGDIFRASTTHCSFLNGGRRKWKEFLASLQETAKLHVALQQQPACKPTLALLLIFPPITAGHQTSPTSYRASDPGPEALALCQRRGPTSKTTSSGAFIQPDKPGVSWASSLLCPEAVDRPDHPGACWV